ncbi:hypothetical protein ANN_11801 [Periplaneta americana]|uniref:Uncharacterized protein n=1 Tax=Periplaneta americana TaxID=6978 RepID=A0ABQ8T6Q5_PERAM|nr:hypothetical protein ANN_11801 [Periplaneta americana]
MDLREVGYDDRDWLNLAQDRDRWRAYVRAAMNLRALKLVASGLTEDFDHRPLLTQNHLLLHGRSEWIVNKKIVRNELDIERMKKLCSPGDETSCRALFSGSDGGRPWITYSPPPPPASHSYALTVLVRFRQESDIHHSCSGLFKYTEYLESSSLQLKDAIGAIDSLLQKQIPGPVREAVILKLKKVLQRNPGFEKIKNVCSILQGGKFNCRLPWVPATMAAMKFAHMTSCAGERTFSSFKSLFVHLLEKEHRLRVFENKVLRKIFGAKRDEVTGEWRKLHNAELHALYSSPDIIRNIKSRRLRWAGHVARMGESRNAYRVLVGRPEGKRPLGRPRRRWEDNIKMDLREVGYDDRDWINLAQDRDRWRAYVRAAMNLRVP